MKQPRTEAGRRLLAREDYNGRSFTLIRVADIIAIEAEAADAVRRADPTGGEPERYAAMAEEMRRADQDVSA